MYLRQMIGFLIKASGDHRLGPQHVAVYMALFQQWCIGGEKPLTIVPAQVEQVAKVRRTTYHKCIKELHTYGYIDYTPSHSAVVGNLMRLMELDV